MLQQIGFFGENSIYNPFVDPNLINTTYTEKWITLFLFAIFCIKWGAYKSQHLVFLHSLFKKSNPSNINIFKYVQLVFKTIMSYLENCRRGYK